MTSRRRISVSQVVKSILDDESDICDDSDDSEECSDVEPEAAAGLDLDTNSASDCEERCGLPDEQSSSTSSSDDEQPCPTGGASGYKSKIGR